MAKTRRDRGSVSGPAAVFILTGISMAVTGWLYGLNLNQIISNTVMSCIGCGMVLFVIRQESVLGILEYDNKDHLPRFYLVYLVGLVIACVLPMLPEAGWFFPVLAVALAIYSSTVTGIVASSVLLVVSVLNAQASVAVFILYFICNLVSILAFRQLEESFRVGIPLFLTVTVLFVATTAMDIMFLPGRLSVEAFIIPMINMFITAILLLILLKNFSVLVIHKYTNIYQSINDQEYVLLIRLKQESRESYFHSIHCAYLCERIAMKLHLNATLAKAGGYYHRIGVLNEENDSSLTAELGPQYRFPPELCELLRQYLDKDAHLTSKEGTILFLVDSVVSTLIYLFQKDADAQPDYNQIIGMIFKRKQENGSLKDSELSLAQLSQVKQILLEEKLYYDFLR